VLLACRPRPVAHEVRAKQRAEKGCVVALRVEGVGHVVGQGVGVGVSGVGGVGGVGHGCGCWGAGCGLVKTLDYQIL
jgi:hypothetical protein